MLFIDNLDETSRDFLAKLVEKTGGDSTIDISMYEIGTELGLDKEPTRKTAEDVIGRHLVEIVSLGGAVRLTDNGLEAAEKLGLSVPGAQKPGSGGLIAEKLPVQGADMELLILGPEGIEGLRILAADLLKEAPPQAQPDLSGLLAHLGSTRPKAGVAVQLLLSVVSELENGETRERALGWVKSLMA